MEEGREPTREQGLPFRQIPRHRGRRVTRSGDGRHPRRGRRYDLANTPKSRERPPHPAPKRTAGVAAFVYDLSAVHPHRMPAPYRSHLLPLPALLAGLLLLVAATLNRTQAAEPAPLPPPSLPVALYLTWQRDPVTTMTVHWHTDWKNGFADSVLEYRAAGSGGAGQPWTRAQGHAIQMPFTDRMIHTVELTGLQGDSIYQFRLGRLLTRESDGVMQFHPHEPVHSFRTLPATLSRPVRFVSGGDIYGRGHARDHAVRQGAVPRTRSS